ncbi:uracil phosphoribosyltransferase [Albibacterium profundi]|uniref:Uracil phosphoribosyltransferase n=1 Tax=Albibacterium profundi TaxID=3134906 RepID=A0ABV5CF94_9SPHI
MVNILTNQNSIANHYIAELRNIEVQSDRMRFRRNLERLGEIFGYEISKGFDYEEASISTPLGEAQTELMSSQPVLATIIRAGLPLHQGLLNVFDQADSGFIAAYRKTKKSGEFEIYKEYEITPDLNNRVVILSDPMIATGRSIVLVCKDLAAQFKIKQLHIVAAIASEEGLEHVKAFVPDCKLWVGAVDDELTSKAYIVPGLGDAGDLAFGSKAGEDGHSK